MKNQTIQSLALMSMKGVGIKTAKRILDEVSEKLKPGEEDWNSRVIAIANDIPRFKPTKEIIDAGFKKAKEILKQIKDNDSNVISIFDDSYPANLMALTDAPLLLYVKGNQDALKMPAVAIIGTREAKINSLNAGKRLGQLFAEKKFAIVSGLALGCDTAGHEGCLSVKGTTIAVLAHGLDMVYPEENRPLAERILREGGLLVSEYPPGTKPRQNTFIQRDRIQAGLSQGTIVIETSLKSGTLHTVRFTEELNRIVGCYWHERKFEEIGIPEGNKMLIQTKRAMELGTPSSLNDFADALKGPIKEVPEENKSSSGTQMKLL